MSSISVYLVIDLCISHDRWSSEVHLTQTNFHFHRAAFSSQLKSKVGHILTKTVVLRTNLNIDDTPIPSRSHTHPSHVKEPLNQLLPESTMIPPFRVKPPLDRPVPFTNRRWVHDTRDLVHKPGQLLEDGLSSVFVCNTFKKRVYPCCLRNLHHWCRYDLLEIRFPVNKFFFQVVEDVF